MIIWLFGGISGNNVLVFRYFYKVVIVYGHEDLVELMVLS
jgi:hypothetical protein